MQNSSFEDSYSVSKAGKEMFSMGLILRIVLANIFQ